MAEEQLSTAQNLQWAKNFHAGAAHAEPGGEDSDGFVKFSREGWDAWRTAIQTFIDDIDNKVLNKIPDLTVTYKGLGNYDSAKDTRTLLNVTAPEEIKQSITDYRDYLVELRDGLKEAYERLNNVDGG
jgi:hypothetical protein